MINTILSDFSFVILFPRSKTYTGTLNGLHTKLTKQHDTYNFFDYYELNQKLLDFYKKLGSKYSINIFTTGFVQNNPAVMEIIKPIFDNICSCADYGIDKRNPEAFKFIAEKLGKKADEILFIDDMEKNIEAAKKAGLATIHYKNFAQVQKEIKKLLSMI